jgi:flagellar basal body-associated protein FliL
MAEDQNAEASTGKKSSSLIKYGILLTIAILLPATVGLLMFNFLIKPRLAPPPETAAPADDLPAFPADMQTAVFDEMRVSVQTEDPDLMAPLLLIKVALSCKDSATLAVVEGKKEYFAAEILAIHQGRTRAELNDPLVSNSILEQIKMQANNLLKRLMPEADLTVLKAMYLQKMVVDL